MKSPLVMRRGSDEIRSLYSEGKSPREVAEELALTVQSVRNVLSGFSDEGQPSDLGSTALESIRSTDSPDHMWPIGEFLSAFRFSTRIRKAIEGYYEWQRATSMSVRLQGCSSSSVTTLREPDISPAEGPEICLQREFGLTICYPIATCAINLWAVTARVRPT